MGACIGITRARTASVDDTSANSTRTQSGNSRKNHPLCHEIIRWKSDVPLTEGQLRSKRDEFWDTAPAFDGRKEIWDALRAGATAAEAADYQLAQAILDGANISVPNGFLTECYDELGTRYQVPIYCLSYPINIVKEDSGRDSPADCSEPVDGGIEITLKLRLSTTLADVKLPVYSKDTIGIAKKKLQSQEGLEPSKQRWFFGGKLLGDKMHIEEAKIQPGYVIQVIVNAEKDESPTRNS
ncbi:Similar to ubtd1: Ubiquitin domain-containing protein 1 (Danio rerio) [Cotesia congregata]|uniref:Similar to ubtd1: Ubiquitin domain-containing protein 1 (Danio rerio) n=1 Tax=Cotesia congregata TaxID=51543 RepID=A0A8J2EKA8_COTCN|nr:Similar to ubtd1: Ubiquitin domain-containing protein 1 (Danio rerio) [Cotesia congregata]